MFNWRPFLLLFSMNAIKKVTRLTKKTLQSVDCAYHRNRSKKVELLAHYFETLVNYSNFEIFPVFNQ